MRILRVRCAYSRRAHTPAVRILLPCACSSRAHTPALLTAGYDPLPPHTLLACPSTMRHHYLRWTQAKMGVQLRPRSLEQKQTVASILQARGSIHEPCSPPSARGRGRAGPVCDPHTFDNCLIMRGSLTLLQLMHVRHVAPLLPQSILFERVSARCTM